MKTVSQRAYARAGLLGNPSDGYHGKTISIIVRNFFAEVTLESSPRLHLKLADHERLEFESLDEFRRQIEIQGYYGSIRLLKAALTRFHDYCHAAGHSLDQDNFSMSCRSTIPRQVGLAGSSAIVTAALRAFMQWYDVDIPPHLLASLTLSAEADLGIPAGLQDRVIQAYEGVVFMDFDPQGMKTEHGLTFGVYEQLDPQSLPGLYVAYALASGEPTEVLHNDLKDRFRNHDPQVVQAMAQFAEFAEQGVEALHHRDDRRLRTLMEENFDLRHSICQLNPFHVRMIEVARREGVCAKYCGSGGAIVGICDDESIYHRLQAAFDDINCRVIRPMIC